MGYAPNRADYDMAERAILGAGVAYLAELFAEHRMVQGNAKKYGLEAMQVGDVLDFPRCGEQYRNGQCKTAARLYARTRDIAVTTGMEFEYDNSCKAFVRVRRVK